MGDIVLWALLTGGITGGVWVSIVLLGNHAKLRDEQNELGTGIESRRAELARLEARLALVESRLASLPSGSAEREQRALLETAGRDETDRMSRRAPGAPT